MGGYNNLKPSGGTLVVRSHSLRFLGLLFEETQDCGLIKAGDAKGLWLLQQEERKIGIVCVLQFDRHCRLEVSNPQA